MKIFILLENDLAPITAHSIVQSMPDVELVYMVPKGVKPRKSLISTLPVRDTSHDTIRNAMFSAGHIGTYFVIPSGAIVMKDFRRIMPPLDQLAKFYKGVSRKYMNADERSHVTQYEPLGIPFMDTTERVQFINTTLNDIPAKDRRVIKMPLSMRFGSDPLITEVFDACKIVESSRDAMKAYILDFGREASNPSATIDECFGYPFDVYGKYAAEVKNQLSRATYKTIQRNAQRSQFAANVRNLLF